MTSRETFSISLAILRKRALKGRNIVWQIRLSGSTFHEKQEKLASHLISFTSQIRKVPSKLVVENLTKDYQQLNKITV